MTEPTDPRIIRLREALRAAVEGINALLPQLTSAARRAGEALGRMAAALRAAFPRLPVERPVDRARRLRVERAMRLRARRGDRRTRRQRRRDLRAALAAELLG